MPAFLIALNSGPIYHELTPSTQDPFTWASDHWEFWAPHSCGTPRLLAGPVAKFVGVQFFVKKQQEKSFLLLLMVPA